MIAGLDIQGVKEVMSILSALEKKEAGKIARTATRQANKEITLPALKASALRISRVDGGGMGAKISNAMKVRAMTKLNRGSYGSKCLIEETEDFIYYTKGSAFDLQTKKLIKGSGKRYFIPAAIEYGHAFPGRGGGRNAPKDVKPQPFLRPVYESNRLKIAQRTLDLLREGIHKYVESNAKK